MALNYAFQNMKENMARAATRDSGVSTKTSIEIANFLRGKTTEKAKKLLERVLQKKQAVPFKRFTDGVGHRKGAGIGQGRFPEKASEEFMKLIKQAEANAQAKGLSSNLLIVHLAVHKSSNTFHQGRQRRRKYKRSHLEIVVEEQEVKKEAKKPVKTEKKEAPKQETKAETKKEAPKTETKQPETKVEEKKEVPKKETVKESKTEDKVDKK